MRAFHGIRVTGAHLAAVAVTAVTVGTAALALAGWGPLGSHTATVAAPRPVVTQADSPESELPKLTPPTPEVIQVQVPPPAAAEEPPAPEPQQVEDQAPPPPAAAPAAPPAEHEDDHSSGGDD